MYELPKFKKNGVIKYPTKDYLEKSNRSYTIFITFLVSGFVSVFLGELNFVSHRVTLFGAAFVYFIVSIYYLIDFKYSRIMLELRDQEKRRR